ncbi:MAG TPA: hypothetical protein VHI51_12010 [Ktedonobacterales bacterium]|jgi:hypothetical protein|nr:hypothetical protein [Ktedonobacterales bacterium]
MKLLPLQQFKCDACGQIIARPDVGWVEWVAGPTRGTKAHGFRIVHNSNRCQYPVSGRVHDVHLSRLLGPDGLAMLLALVAPGGRTGNREDGVESLEEWSELVRRLQIPHYEEARQYWSYAETDGLFAGLGQHALYSQATLRAILMQYGHGVGGHKDAKDEDSVNEDESGS